MAMARLSSSDLLASVLGLMSVVVLLAQPAEAKKLSPEEAAGITIGIVLFGFFAAIVYFAVNTRNLREEAKEKRLMSEAVRRGLIVEQN